MDIRQHLQPRTLKETKGDFFSSCKHFVSYTGVYNKSNWNKEFKDSILVSNSRKQSSTSLRFAVIRQTTCINYHAPSPLFLLEQILLFLRGEDRTREQIQVNSSKLLFQLSKVILESRRAHPSSLWTSDRQQAELAFICTPKDIIFNNNFYFHQHGLPVRLFPYSVNLFKTFTLSNVAIVTHIALPRKQKAVV